MQAEVTIYTTRFCPFCLRAKMLLNQKNVHFTEIAVDGDAAKRAEMMTRSGRHTVPQIWVGDQHIGGCDELYSLDRQHALDALLHPVAP